VLELGSFEGGHSLALAANESVERVVSIEGRSENIEKSRFVQRIPGDRKVEFIQADLEHMDLRRLGRFDAVLCLGVLYHLSSPWRLIKQVAAVSDTVFIWTHFVFDKDSELLTSDTRGRYYVESSGDDLSGGLGELSCRLTLGSLMHCLDDSGLRLVESCEIDMTHPSGPGLLLGARRT
jgi:SAM-dependent methyltransferase